MKTGGKHSDEARAKMSGIKGSDEVRQKQIIRKLKAGIDNQNRVGMQHALNNGTQYEPFILTETYIKTYLSMISWSK